MSFINDALVKAQAEKDDRYLDLENVLQANPVQRTFRSKYPVVVLVVALVIGAVSLVFFYGLAIGQRYGSHEISRRLKTDGPARLGEYLPRDFPNLYGCPKPSA